MNKSQQLMTKVTSLRAKLFNEDSKWIYEELVSFFGNESLVPKNREEFSKWLRRGEWQTRKCDELAKENEKLKKQLESKEDIEMETAAGTLGVYIWPNNEVPCVGVTFIPKNTGWKIKKAAIDEKIERDGLGSPKAVQTEKSPEGNRMIATPKMEKPPKNCHECPLSYRNEEECPLSYRDEENGDYWCPWHHYCTVDALGEESERMDGCPPQMITAR